MTINPRVGLGVLIFNDSNEILLGKRLASHGEATWGPPGGHIEFSESFEDCAIREVIEETGLVIKDPEFLSITNDVFEKENKHYVSIFMKVDFPQDQEIKNNEPDKVEEWQWFELSNLPLNLFLPLEKLINNKSYGCKL